MTRLTLAEDGAKHLKAALTNGNLSALETTLSALEAGKPGIRLSSLPGLRSILVADGFIGRHAAQHLGQTAQPVRVILFDKTPEQNWSLAWHQDRTIAVRNRIDIAGFGPWTIKSGIQHVAPPQSLLDRMLTIRVHMDSTDANNAPLLIARGSHRYGRVAEGEVLPLVENSLVHACLADRRDIWLYATPILHASEAARMPRRRRVLQIDYSADGLPDGLEWMGI